MSKRSGSKGTNINLQVLVANIVSRPLGLYLPSHPFYPLLSFVSPDVRPLSSMDECPCRCWCKLDLIAAAPAVIGSKVRRFSSSGDAILLIINRALWQGWDCMTVCKRVGSKRTNRNLQCIVATSSPSRRRRGCVCHLIHPSILLSLLSVVSGGIRTLSSMDESLSASVRTPVYIG
jgi:hypothetical protein